ncbi:MAG: hypothetical protein RLZZ214_1825 [Verrucomicrobiota bacterium]|jgi:hypothetical protein
MPRCRNFIRGACWGLVKPERACHGFLMFKKPFLLLLAGLFVCSVQVGAQDATDTTEKAGESAGPSRFWQATLGGGHFMVALDRIASVSRHKYVLDGALIIDEVTVDTVGQALTRFYFISPITDETPGNTVSDVAKRGRELVEKAAQRTGADVQNMVMKKYPDTSHAKSIEYRILSEAELSSLYASVRSAWETGRGRKFTAK